MPSSLLGAHVVKAVGVVDVLEDLKEKAEEQLAEAQDVAEHRTSATISAGLELEAQVAALTEALTAAKIDAEDAEQKHRSTISELVQVEEQLETYKLTLRDAEGALEECVKDREAEKERERALQEEAQEWKRR